MEIVIKDIDELPAIAERLIELAGDRKLWFFTGQIGAGKTTLIQHLCRAWGVREAVTSPTYALVNVYDGDMPIYHLDLYRLGSLEEALDMGIEEYLYSGQHCLVEWPEIVGELASELDPLRVHLEIEPDSSRKIVLLERNYSG
ncbi:MAG: tRNA (adenosine(37)-N6)-threonylcarbamoyltransferase complex ATPase subunit type 1 TsaE [Bacteroidetes bacterium]|nr:MAG: tRNA (adenosine(37)-N6)-threonylcarbamoyltransferase complex ATPase subunit type 1 TsaE [Bacteroidota bacterium]